MTLRLLGIKLLMLKGSLRSSEEGRHRAPAFAGLSLLFWFLLYRASLRVVEEAMKLDPVGELLVQKLLSITFLVFLGLLVFSNIVTAFSTFYLADDMEFLVTRPIPKDALFTSRFVESLLQSSWVVLLFGMPIFVAAGVGVGAPPWFYVLLIAVMIPFVAIPTGIATLLALFVTNILAADRTRDAALFFGLVAFSVLFVVVRALQPERLLNPDSFDSIGEMLRMLSAPTTAYLPSDWAINVVIPALFSSGAVDKWSIALLFLTPLALFFVSAWLHRGYYMRGYSKAQEGRHGRSVLTAFRDWLFKRTTTVRGSMDKNLAQIAAHGERSISTLGQLVRKDLSVFLRDASQWSQLLVVVAIMVIYLVNFKYFEIAANENLLGDVGLFSFNLAACGFVVVALSGRFLFPAVSVEGRSFWMILQAPISLERFLVGKWLGMMGPIVIIGQFIIWSSNLLVGQSLANCLMASLITLVNTVGVAAMAVGFGAVYPQFHNPNAAKIASSFGAVIYMILGMFVVLAVIMSTFHVSTYLGHIYVGASARPIYAKHILVTLTGLALPFLVATATIRMGAASLRSRL
ncbi:MAG: hypothetical protein H0U74_03900 [Bradymonadaceae bacterium]|nr:hypothetical protein [Lujinxingiaceae bacterium]